MKTILIVDDSKTVVARLENSIKEKLKDVNIIVAYSYKEAVKHILKEETIHLAILDLNLPDAKEGDVVNFAIARDIPSIVLTGLLNDKLREFILEKDVLDYYNKQDIKNINFLISAIDRVLKNYDTNVLVVDDSVTQMSVALEILNSMNISADKASDGAKALELIEKNDKKYKLVLTDYNMPNMDGLGLTFKIRERYNKDEMGVIALSANEDPEISTKFLKVGANDFLNKPYKKAEFMTRVNANLEVLDLFQQTKDLANKDFLTGAYNRRFFFDSGYAIFDKARRSGKELTLAMFDIDKFKSINDTYGHDVGDVAIQEMSKLLNEKLRASDLIARFGGEEFCVLLENIELDDVKALFEKIRFAFEMNVINVGDLELSFTVSIGICYGIESSLDEMIKKADEGLYHCKENGRNQFYIHESIII